MSLVLLFAQHVSNASTSIFSSLRLCVGILLWFDVCWRYGVIRLGWCGTLMQAEACFSIYCSTCFECSYIHLQELATYCGFISCVVLLWFDVCWCYGVVRLG